MLEFFLPTTGLKTHSSLMLSAAKCFMQTHFEKRGPVNFFFLLIAD